VRVPPTERREPAHARTPPRGTARSQIFPTAGYRKLYDAMAAALKAGRNTVHRARYNVLDNPQKGIKGGWQVRGAATGSAWAPRPPRRAARAWAHAWRGGRAPGVAPPRPLPPSPSPPPHRAPARSRSCGCSTTGWTRGRRRSPRRRSASSTCSAAPTRRGARRSRSSFATTPTSPPSTRTTHRWAGWGVRGRPRDGAGARGAGTGRARAWRLALQRDCLPTNTPCPHCRRRAGARHAAVPASLLANYAGAGPGQTDGGAGAQGGRGGGAQRAPAARRRRQAPTCRRGRRPAAAGSAAAACSGRAASQAVTTQSPSSCFATPPRISPRRLLSFIPHAPCFALLLRGRLAAATLRGYAGAAATPRPHVLGARKTHTSRYFQRFAGREQAWPGHGGWRVAGGGWQRACPSPPGAAQGRAGIDEWQGRGAGTGE
jgi:hypothetical protein